jgi:hypothetical protein
LFKTQLGFEAGGLVNRATIAASLVPKRLGPESVIVLRPFEVVF